MEANEKRKIHVVFHKELLKKITSILICEIVQNVCSVYVYVNLFIICSFEINYYRTSQTIILIYLCQIIKQHGR